MMISSTNLVFFLGIFMSERTVLFTQHESQLLGNIEVFPFNLGLNQMTNNTDYGQPMKPFVHRNPKLLGMGRHLGQINFGGFWVFSINQPLFLQKTMPLYPNPKYLFEFGTQRIRDSAIVCPQSVTHKICFSKVNSSFPLTLLK